MIAYFQVHQLVNGFLNFIKIYVFVVKFACKHRIRRNLEHGQGHIVQWRHDTAFHKFDHNADNQNGQSKEQRQELDKEYGFVSLDSRHGNVYTHIRNGLPHFIFYRFIDHEEPTINIIRDNRLDFFASQELWQIRLIRGIEFDFLAGFYARDSISIKVKHDHNAVFHELIHIKEFRLRETFANALQYPFCTFIAFGRITAFYIIVNFFGINRHGSRLRCPRRNVGKVTD